MDDQVIWMIVGFAGQALFASSGSNLTLDALV